MKSSRLSWAVLAFALFGVFAFWWSMVMIHPIPFWGIDEEGTIMAISQSFNIDFWLSEGGHRGLSQAQFYQPGVWFQIVSWVTYRLAAPDFGMSAAELFKATLRDPSRFWLGTEIAALILSLISLTALWYKARIFKPSVLVITLAIYFVCVSATHYGVFLLWNESFPLLLAVIFFGCAQSLLKRNAETRNVDWQKTIVCGFIGGCLYLHKMNYVAWSLALIPALIVQARIIGQRWQPTLAQCAAYLAAVALTVYALGNLFLTRAGYKEMIRAHAAIFLGSGIYGNGEKTIVKGAILQQNLKMFAENDRYTMLFVSFFIVVALFTVWKHRHERAWISSYVPEGTLLVGALVLSVLALLKHLQMHYTVSVAAMFPLLMIWLAQSSRAKWHAILIPVIAFAVYRNVDFQIDAREAGVATYARIREDEKEILAFKTNVHEKTLWMYRYPSPTLQRLFTLSFSGLDAKLLPFVVETQGEHYIISPWQAEFMSLTGYTKIAETNWRYIIVPKTPSQDWIDKKLHPWLDDPTLIRRELKESIVFEKTVPPLSPIGSQDKAI